MAGDLDRTFSSVSPAMEGELTRGTDATSVESMSWNELLDVAMHRAAEVGRLHTLMAEAVEAWDRCDRILRDAGYEAMDRESALLALVQERDFLRGSR